MLRHSFSRERYLFIYMRYVEFPVMWSSRSKSLLHIYSGKIYCT